jgi:ribosomal protein S18 acetylase RimI-like enzyme
MGISRLISRLVAYYERNGSGATVRRAWLALSRLFSPGVILFYCNLSGWISEQKPLPGFLTVERKRREEEVSSLDLEEIIKSWNPRVAHQNIKERFGLGASLWMIKSDSKLAGYGWTLRGHTIERHYYRLGPDDVHLFDFYVFPRYRGQGLNPLLVTEVLRTLAVERIERAFIEAAAWNRAQLASLRKTSFHRLGRASKLTILRCTIVFWDDSLVDSDLDDVPIAAPRKGSKVSDLRA